MVRKVETIVTLTDDLDGSKAERTVVFAFDGASYEIDLSKRNVAAFERALAPFLKVARKAPRHRRSPTSPTSRTRSRSDLATIRDWARSAGLEVSERGRIAQAVQDAYDAAH